MNIDRCVKLEGQESKLDYYKERRIVMTYIMPVEVLDLIYIYLLYSAQ